MKTIFILILAFLGGLLFGIILVRAFIWFSNFLLGRKTRKEILKNESDLTKEERERRNFKFKDKAYNLKEMVEYDLKAKKEKIKARNKKIIKFLNPFYRDKKGVSDYDGSQPTGNAGNPGLINEQVSAVKPGITTGNSTTSRETTTAEQPSINPAEASGKQRDFSRNLFEERTKNHRLLL